MKISGGWIAAAVVAAVGIGAAVYVLTRKPAAPAPGVAAAVVPPPAPSGSKPAAADKVAAWGGVAIGLAGQAHSAGLW